MHVERRTVSELLARYELEPTLQDIYVEGTFDRDILSAFLSGGDSDLKFYEIGTVDIPADTLKRHKLTDGNKQRVVALARELSVVDEHCKYVCVADKDLDHWLGSLEITPGLNWTKYTSIELYFLRHDIMSSILVKACKIKTDDFDRLFTALVELLSHLYALRLANRYLELNMRIVTFESSVTLKGGVPELSIDEYVEKLLNSNAKSGHKAAFLEQYGRFKKLLDGDARERIHGHDLVCALAWVVRSMKGIKETSSEIVLRRKFVLAACMDQQLADEMRELLSRRAA